MLKKCNLIMPIALILILLSSLSAQAENTLVLPAGTTEIYAQAFMGDTAIGEVTLPEGLLRIESQAFAESSVTGINLPSALTYIAEDAFENCNGLKNVTVQEGTYAYTRAHEIGLFDLRAVISGNIKTAVAGESIIWTTKAINGVSPYKYLFEVYRNGEQIDSRAYTADASYTYQFPRAGEYYAIVKIKDDDGNVASAQSSTIIVEADMPVIASVSCDRENIQLMETASWTATVKRGIAPYTYTYVLKMGDEMIVQSTGKSNVFSHIFDIPGEYMLSVTVTDADGSVSVPSTQTLFVAPRALEITEVRCKETVEVGNEIIWTVEAAGGVMPLYYAFELYKDGEEIGGATFGGSNYFIYVPEEAGKYFVRARVQDAQNTTVEMMSGETIAYIAMAEGSFKYYVSDDKAVITKYTGSAADVSIPSTLGGYLVTSIDEFSFQYCRGLRNVTIPGSVTNIGNSAFLACSNLKSVTISEGVTNIGHAAFWGCSSLESVTIPGSVTEMGEYVFYGCSSLNNVTIPGSVRSIGRYAFYMCSSLTNVEIPEGVTSIGSSAFSGCSKLVRIDIPGSVTSIGSSAFEECEVLKNVTIPSSVTSIGERAFLNCTCLASVTIPEGVTSIGAKTFYGCWGLVRLTIPESVTSIDDSAFYDCPGLTIYCPENSTAHTHCVNNNIIWKPIPAATPIPTAEPTPVPTATPDPAAALFKWEVNEGGESVTITEYIGTDADSVVVPASIQGLAVTCLGDGVFQGHAELTQVDLPEGLKKSVKMSGIAAAILSV